MALFQHPIFLEGEKVKIAPLQNEHFEALKVIAKNKNIWEHLPIDGTDETILISSLKTAILKRAYGEQYPFVIFDKATNKVIGSTRFFEIFQEHKKLEIGWTWYDPEYWGKGHNIEVKLLLLTYCFEQLQLNRVQLKTRTTNLRSMKAIQKIGATQEGVLRKDRIQLNGEVRDTVMYSIINDEWEVIKAHLQDLLLTYENA